MLYTKKTELYIRFQALTLFGLYAIYIMAGYKSFNVWSQIDIFIGRNPLQVLYHLHGLRYLVTWPVLWIADHLDIHRNLAFSVFVVFNLMLSTVLTAMVQAKISRDAEPRWHVWAYLFIPIFITLSFAMNGRLSYMMLGVSLMLYFYSSWISAVVRGEPAWKAFIYGLVIMMALGLLSVSSGCFTVGMIVAVLHTFVFAVIKGSSAKRLIHIVVNLLVVSVFLAIQYGFIHKNLGYYGGSVFAMLMHGPGKILLNNLEIVSVAVSLLALLFVLYEPYILGLMRSICTQYFILITPVLLVLVSLVIGMFGYSALLTGSTSAMILLVHLIGLGCGHQVPMKQRMRGMLSGAGQQLAITPRRKAIAGIVGVLFGICTYGILTDAKNHVDINIKVINSENNRWLIHWDIVEPTKLFGSMSPGKMVLDDAGNAYVVDNNTRILRISDRVDVSVYAGNLKAGDKNGARQDARFGKITDIVLDKKGNLFIADESNNKIKKIDTSGMVSTVAGNGKIGRLYSGCKALECMVTAPQMLAFLPDGSLIISAGLELVRLRSDGRMRPFLYVQEVYIKPDNLIGTRP